MGNQPSTNTISNFSFDALILDSVLSEVPVDNVNLSVQKVKNIKINELAIIADKIFEKGIINHFCSEKYAQLAKKLCDEIPPDGFVSTSGSSIDWNLQDYINRKAHYYFEVLHNSEENGRPLTNDKIYGISVFLGNLYNFDLLTSETIYLWILNDAYPISHEVRQHLLFTIKSKVLKVTEDQNQVCNDPFVWELLDLLSKEGVIRTKIVSKPIPKSQALAALRQIQASQFREENDQSTSSESNQASKNKPTISIPDSFEQYLKSLKSPPVVAFDIQLFKTCSENDRKESATRMLKCVLADSRQAPKYARLALSILQLNMKTSSTKKSFINYLSDACEKQLDQYKDASKPNFDWIEMESFGNFLAELYNLEVLRIYITNTWLENTRKIADENSLALKMLFSVVKTIYPKMKVKDARTLGVYLKHFERYQKTGRIPVAYVSFYNTALTASKQRDRSSSAVSSTSESSQGNDQLTGAVKKQSQSIYTQQSDTTKICDEFTRFLIQLKTKSSANFTVNLDTASDAAIRGCALLLIEHTLMNDTQISMFAHVTKHTILKNIKKEDRLKVFTANFALYIYAEMNKCLKTEKPTSSDWKSVEKLGKYICELYKQDIIEGMMVKAWLSKLEFTATIGSEEAAKEFFTSFPKVSEKFKRDFPEEFEQFEQFSNRELPKAPINDRPGKSSSDKLALLMSNEMREFNYILSNLNTITPERLNCAIDNLKIDDRGKMEMLVQVYFEAYKKHKGNPVYAYLAKQINQQINLPNCSFKNLLIAMVIGEFNNVSTFMRTKTERDAVECHAKCIGELYSIGWLDESILTACLDTLCGNNFESINHVQAFRNFINNIALDIAKYGHGEVCQKYYRMLTARQSSYLEAFICSETLEILENIWSMAKMRNAHNIDEIFFEEILRKLSVENIALSSSRINLSTVGCKEDLNQIAETFINTCIQNPDNTVMYVKFLSEIKEVKVESIDGKVIKICEAVIECCKEEFKNYAEGFSLKNLPNVITILGVQSELYNTSLASIEDIKFFLNYFFDENSFEDNKIDCLDYFLRRIGPKIDGDQKEILNEYFEKLTNAKMTTEYVKEQVKALVAVREKEWMGEDEFIAFSSIDMEKIEEFLKSLKDDEVSSKSNILKRHILTSESNLNDFIHVLFKCNMENENIDLKSAHLCKLLTSEENEMKLKFIENLNNFMRCRSITFTKVTSDANEKLRKKLVNIILLNAQLYSLNIVDDRTIQQWLVPSLTSHLNLSEISKFCLLVSPRIDESESIQLKARLMNLESAMHEKLLETCSTTKSDLKSLEN